MRKRIYRQLLIIILVLSINVFYSNQIVMGEEATFSTDNPTGEMAKMKISLKEKIVLASELIKSIEKIGGKSLIEKINKELEEINKKGEMVISLKTSGKPDYLIAEGFYLTDKRQVAPFTEEEKASVVKEKLGDLLFVWPLNPEEHSLEGVNLQYGITPVCMSFTPLGNSMDADTPTYRNSSIKITPDCISKEGNCHIKETALKVVKPKEEKLDINSLIEHLVDHKYSESGALELRPRGDVAEKIKQLGKDAVPFLIDSLKNKQNSLQKTKGSLADIMQVQIMMELSILKELTNQDFGNDQNKYQEWWKKNKGKIRKGK
jgi:hypothetical protein